MKHNYEQEIRYRLPKVLSQDPHLGQRDGERVWKKSELSALARC
ncbi:MAG: hypothetical protein ACNYWU_05315 [Desulfobacterales bacterium]